MVTVLIVQKTLVLLERVKGIEPFILNDVIHNGLNTRHLQMLLFRHFAPIYLNIVLLFVTTIP